MRYLLRHESLVDGIGEPEKVCCQDMIMTFVVGVVIIVQMRTQDKP